MYIKHCGKCLGVSNDDFRDYDPSIDIQPTDLIENDDLPDDVKEKLNGIVHLVQIFCKKKSMMNQLTGIPKR